MVTQKNKLQRAQIIVDSCPHHRVHLPLQRYSYAPVPDSLQVIPQDPAPLVDRFSICIRVHSRDESNYRLDQGFF